MKVSRTLSVFVSSCLVYAAVAVSSACSHGSGSSGSSGPVPDANADPTSGSRLLVEYLQADDGATQPVGWFDSTRNEECAWATADDGQLRCLPAADTSVTAAWEPGELFMFTDAACTQPAFWSQNTEVPCAPPRGGYFRYSTVACGAAAGTYTYGAPFTGQIYYIETVGSPCTPLPANGIVEGGTMNATVNFQGTPFFVGVLVPASSFVGATRKH